MADELPPPEDARDRAWLALVAEGLEHGLDTDEAESYADAMASTLYGSGIALGFAVDDLRAVLGTRGLLGRLGVRYVEWRARRATRG